MRRDEGKYQLRALLIVAGCFALLLIVPMALIRWQMYVAKRTAADAVANFSNLKQPEVKKNHELKAVDVAQKINVKKTNGGQTIVSGPDSMLLTDSPTDSDDPDISGKYPTPVEVVEQMPQFPGGLKALMQWLTVHVVYPPICMRDNVQGRVEVSFLVDRDGNIKDPEVTKKVHPLLDREALLTIRRMPKWEPGKIKGKASIVRVTIPIVFSL